MAPQRRRSALNTEPSRRGDNLTRVSPGVYRDSSGNLVTRRGGSLPGGNRGGNRSADRNRNRDRTRNGNGNSNTSKTISRKKDIKSEQDFRNQTVKRQVQEGQIDSMYVGQKISDFAGKFDPNNPYAKAPQQGYTQALRDAQQSVMSEFNRTMNPQFERQNQEFQQRMMSQGIDPNSDAYKIQYQQMQQAQNDARQAAQSQAYQLGMQNQNQGWNQYMQAVMTPAQLYQATQDQWKVPYLAQQEAEQGEKNRQAQLAATRMSTGASMHNANVAAQSAKDAQYMQMMQQYGNQGQQQPNYLNSAISGATQGGMLGATNTLLK